VERTTKKEALGLAAILFCALSSGVAAAGSLECVKRIPHSGWSEGLEWHNAQLWGSYPHSLRVFDPETGDEIASYGVASGYQESVTWFQGRLYALSYSDNKIYQGTLTGTTIKYVAVGTVPDVHGWGLTHDDHDLILSGNGQPYLYFIDPGTMQTVKTLTTQVDDLEDLAWDGRWIWASSYSYFPGTEFRIDPATGAVVEFYTLPEPSECPKLDGVEVHDGQVYITGKNCPWTYIVEEP
jgi:glutamine cyclotransferase